MTTRTTQTSARAGFTTPLHSFSHYRSPLENPVPIVPTTTSFFRMQPPRAEMEAEGVYGISNGTPTDPNPLQFGGEDPN